MYIYYILYKRKASCTHVQMKEDLKTRKPDKKPCKPELSAALPHSQKESAPTGA